MRTLILVIYVAVALLPCTLASNILMVLSLGSLSHKNIFTPIAQKMGQKGHDVTVVSMYASKNNRGIASDDVVASTAYEYMKNVTGEFNVFDMHQKYGSDVNRHVMKSVISRISDYCDAFLRDPALTKVWKNKPDLILLPALMNECGLAFVAKFQVPFIYVTQSGLTPWTSDIIGNPEHPGYVPNVYLPFSDKMSLMQRVKNTVSRIALPVARQFFIINRIERTVQIFLNKTVSLSEIERNASVVLVNSHHALGQPRPQLPNVVDIGGIHCRQANKLSKTDKQLASFLDRSKKNKVLLFSLGSIIKSQDMPQDFINKFVKVFSELPYNVVWKFEGRRPANLSSNVLIREWIPQQDILGHPSIGAFFTHGGLLSMQEAVYHGVPMISLPLMSDQSTNALKSKALGLGLSLDLSELTEENIKKTIVEVMNSPSYRKEIQKRSLVFRDQETHPLDRAIYWSEYVIRHQGAKHLRPASLELSFVQYYLIDVILVLTLITSIPFLLLWIIFKIFIASGKRVLRFV